MFRYTAVWGDASGGGPLVTSWYQLDQVLDICNVLSGLSGAKLLALTATEIQTGYDTHPPAAAALVSQAARITYKSSNGSSVPIIIPAAIAGVYTVDGETVSPSAVAGLTTAIIAHGASAAVETISAYGSGHAVQLPRLPVYQ